MRGERSVDCFVFGHCLNNFVAYCHVVFMDVFQKNDMKKTFSKIADVGKQIYIRPVVQQLRDKGKFVVIKIFLLSGCLSK